LPLDASHEDIYEAVDDLSFEPDSDPQLLEDAQARLLSARDRLSEEIGWMPECNAQRQSEIRDALISKNMESLDEFRGQAIGLARLNLTVVGNNFRANDIDAASELVRDIARWDPDQTRDLLDEARARGGFKPIDTAQWAESVATSLSAFAKQVTPTFTSISLGQGKLIALIREVGDNILLTDFFEAMQKYYGAGVEKKMGEVEARIDKTTQLIKVTPHDDALINTLISLLGQWSAYRQPIQVMEAARSLDDQVSSDMFKKVRSLTIYLANEFRNFETALLIAESLLQNFTHLPNCRSQLETQMPILRFNVGSDRLFSACATAKSRARKFASCVQGGGIENNKNDLVSDVVENFELAIDNAGDRRDDLFFVVRDVSIEAFNSSRNKQVILTIYKWLLRYEPSFELSNKMREDLRQIGLNIPGEYRNPE